MENVLGCLFLKLMFDFFELKLDTKEGTANERTNLHIFIIFINKQRKKNSEIADQKKMSKAIAENK